jgi:Domain of unknown function (DUF6265)
MRPVSASTLSRWTGCFAIVYILPWSMSAGLTTQTPAPASASASAPAAPAAPAASIDSLSWMVGSWTGKMGKAGIEEHWIPPAGKTMMAVARTIVGDRTVAFEFLRIEQRADAIVYIAQPGGRPPTEFRLTASTPTSATFENPQHDHPKLIRYTKEGESTLIAEIEGDEKGKRVSQRFVFKK